MIANSLPTKGHYSQWDASRKHILAVDDSEGTRDVVRGYFERRGYKIPTVATASEVLAFLDESHVDLVIIDIVMPGVDGLELLEMIRFSHPSLSTIMFTGVGYDEELFQEARRKGASGFVTKGSPLSQLLFEVHHVLNHNS